MPECGVDSFLTPFSRVLCWFYTFLCLGDAPVFRSCFVVYPACLSLFSDARDAHLVLWGEVL
jgi:hypothetical protein